MLPSIESLRCFRAGARLLNFRAAARSVALTPAAFGQRIKQLEHDLSAPLFVRSTRSVQLTEAGLALLPLAENCLAAAEQCAHVAKGGSKLATVDVTLGTRHELGISWVLPQLDTLAKKFPFLRLHLYFGSGSDLLLRVRSMEIDCAITSSYLADAKLDGLRVHREDYAFVGAAALLAKKPFAKPEDAQKHTLIDVDHSLPLFRYLREAPGAGDVFRFGDVSRFGTIEAIRRRVLAGAGVAVLPEYLVRKDLADGKVLPILPKMTLLHDFFRLVIRADDPRRTVFEELAEVMSNEPLK